MVVLTEFLCPQREDILECMEYKEELNGDIHFLNLKYTNQELPMWKMMIPKKKIPAGTKLPVRLSAAERRLIREHTFYDPTFCAEGPDKGTVAVDMDLDAIEDLQGYVAAEANHTEDRKLEQVLGKLSDRLRVFLDKYGEQ